MNENQAPSNAPQEPGKGAATASLVLGIIGLVLAGSAKHAGNTSGIRTAGFVLSLIGLIGGVIAFAACAACVGAAGILGSVV